MPIYSAHCPACERSEDYFSRVSDRNASVPECCGAPMQRVLSAPMVSVQADIGYRCPMSGESVSTHRRRKYLMDRENVVDSRELTDTWKKNREKRAIEKQESSRYYESLPDSVKKAAETISTT